MAGLAALGCCLHPAAGLAAPPRPLGVLLLGTGASGVFRSLDGGASWAAAGDGLPGGGVWAVQADPAAPNVAYAATGSLFRTADAGRHWARVPGLPEGGPGITALAAQGPLILAAGGGGLVEGGGARPWAVQSLRTPGGAPRALLPVGPDLLYTVGGDGALWLHGALPWAAGGDWTRLRGLPAGPVTALAYVPESARADAMCPVRESCVALYAAVAGRGLWRSLDSGHSWFQESAEDGALPVRCTVRALLVTEQRTIYAAVDGQGLYRSQRSGQFWKPARRGPRATIAALAQVGQTVVAATLDGGVQVYDAAKDTFALRSVARLPREPIGIGLAWLPAPVPAPPTPATLPGPCSSVGGYPLCEPFRRFYWSAYPPLLLFGLPLGPATRDRNDPRLIVQYFDRARFEYRPDLPGGVRLAPLGRLLTAGRRFPARPAAPLPNPRPFPQTGYSTGGAFLKFWQQHGGARILGYPISSLLVEANGDGSGATYLLQYFENARVELHPEQANTPFTIELGLLGRQYLCRTSRAYCRN